MKRYWQIYKLFFTSSLARELEFRANFFAKLLLSLTWIGFFSLIVLVVFSNSDSVAGWNKNDSFLLVGVAYFISGCIDAFAFGLMEIPQQVRQGTLDLVITKPVDSQFWVSTRRFNFDRIGTLIAATGIILWFALHRPQLPSGLDWLGFAIMLIVGVGLFYCFNMFLMTLGIYFVRVDNLWVLGETAMNVSRFPADIFSAQVRRVFLYIIPFSLLGPMAVMQIKNGFDGQIVLIGLGWLAFAAIGSRLFWRRALRSYSSASS
ncbi:MAG: ABC-2 family transporter protein [Armatimonadetes bacterium]|nr:ABC-2 family transporter protein [Armatimonadota bacterium]